MSALPTPSRPATLTPDRAGRRTAALDRGLPRPAVARAGSLAAAWAVILVIAMIGVLHATGRSQDPGVSLAAAGLESVGAGSARSVVVRNESGAPFTGLLVMSTGRESSSTPIRLQPGQIRAVAISQALDAACRGAVDVRLDAPGVAESIRLSCPGGSRP